ncbi:alanine--tRNA ligase [Candidatus Kapabacteria bacterium]|nr:alanine--tRNA ligase [Candidatus Kapabacteria bacterium]
MKSAKQIRQEFLDFFKAKDHNIVPSAPVIPHGDATLLFTNAGMNQFKDVFLGQGSRDYKRAVDTQKCIRVSGKHNDLEEVGVDHYHHTFFEMLGNWSFGDFYKEETIAWSWELLTDVWGLDKNRLYATVFRTDDEAYEIWKKYLPEDRIQRFDEKDNFWEMGDTGPCGPCSEIHYDGTKDLSGAALVNAGHEDVIEIWNLVFVQYNRKADGSLENLKNTHVDTGMGFERITRVIQGKSSNYDTDIFMPFIREIEKLSGKKYGADLKSDIAMRVISDHIRTLSFTIADGAIPGNEGRSYVLRRILRRASRFGRDIGLKEAFFYKLVDTVADNFGDIFPEVEKQKELIKKIIKGEEESFLQTLESGLVKLEEMSQNLKEGEKISGSIAFLLYDSFGFPLDLTQLIARDKGLLVDVPEFEKLMADQKARSQSARKSNSEEADESSLEFKTTFTGYDQFETESKIVFAEGNRIVLEKTPFYVEKGGQVSDTGTLLIEGNYLSVVDTKLSGDAIVHIIDTEIDSSLVGKIGVAKINVELRRDIMRNHSATHLLHEALRTILGEHIQQQGSLVTSNYLRFDFNHFEKVPKSDLKKIEDLVNQKIFETITVETKEMSLDEAKENDKIKMYFGDKYGSNVRAVFMNPAYSVELCGGTHVKNTAEIGYFKITSESSVASGVRRIEAISGRFIEKEFEKLNTEISNRLDNENSLKDQIKQLEKEISKLKSQDANSGLEDLIDTAKSINGINVVSAQVDVEDMDAFRDLGETLRNKLEPLGIGLLAKLDEDKVQLVCVVTDELKNKYPAGKLVGLAAKTLGGGGGGKPHLATAGGRKPEKLPELLSKQFYDIVENYG